MKKRRAIFDINVNPLQKVWLEVLGVDAPWLAQTAVAPQSQVVLIGIRTGADPAITPNVVLDGASTIKPDVALDSASTIKPDVALDSASTVAPTLRIAKQHTNLDDLNVQIRACKACSLCQNRTQAVVGTGVLRPAIMIVGEAPSEQEDRLGLPFVGRSGELLDKMLAAIGLQRDRDVYLTHVVKCRSPNSRNPRPEELAACLPFLLAEVATVQPQLILAMGRSAAQALLGQDAPLETLREHMWSLNTATHAASAIPILVTYHPAFLLRRPIDKKRAWQDLQKARDLVNQVH
jgi:uracil-DNA glycosylase family 4